MKRPGLAGFEADFGGQALVLLEFPQCRIRRGRLVPAKTPKLIWREELRSRGTWCVSVKMGWGAVQMIGRYFPGH